MEYCEGRWLRKHPRTVMIKLHFKEWPKKEQEDPFVEEVWHCPLCKKVTVLTDWPGPL